jgi:DNA adenine methylase
VFNRYIELFFGSGAVFFDLHAAGRLRDRDVVLIDGNADLIGCYETVRAQPDEVASELDRLAAAHARGGQTQYYAVRDGQFNPIRDRLRADDGRMAYTPQLAAMLIYLNRTGFNGLFRLNARGAFNVPAGRYDRPKIADREKLARVAEALSGARLRLVWGSFESALGVAAAGDFVYFEPPYAPLSRTANFTSYTAPRFNAQDQRRRQQIVLALAARSCNVLLGNSTADEIAALYERNADSARRGPVEEFLITNYCVGQPDQLTAFRAGIGHPRIADERHEPARRLTRAGRADRRRRGVERRHAQRPARVGHGMAAGLDS